MKKQNRKQGFTLVELLVVIAILAILATVSVVGYTSFIKKAHQSNALAEANQLKEAIRADFLAGEDFEIGTVKDENTTTTYILRFANGHAEYEVEVENETTSTITTVKLVNDSYVAEVVSGDTTTEYNVSFENGVWSVTTEEDSNSDSDNNESNNNDATTIKGYIDDINKAFAQSEDFGALAAEGHGKFSLKLVDSDLVLVYTYLVNTDVEPIEINLNSLTK